jgi:hypothetical protein
MDWRYVAGLIAVTSLYEPSRIPIIDYSDSHHVGRVATSVICDHTGVVSNGMKRKIKKKIKKTLTVMAT